MDPQLEHAETCSTAEATRGHCACVHAVVCGMKLADRGITTEPTLLTASRSTPADIFTTAAVPGRSAALDVCVASIAAAARGDAAQAVFRPKLSHYKNEIGQLRATGYSVSSSCVDSGRTTAPGGHSKASVCSRRRHWPEWAADVVGRRTFWCTVMNSSLWADRSGEGKH